MRGSGRFYIRIQIPSFDQGKFDQDKAEAVLPVVTLFKAAAFAAVVPAVELLVEGIASRAALSS